MRPGSGRVVLLLCTFLLAFSISAAPRVSIEELRAHKQAVKAKSKTVRPAPADHMCSHASPIACGSSATGQLQATDCLLDDQTFYDQFTIEGQVGQLVVIDAASAALDMYLVLLDPDGEAADEDDDGGEGTDSRISYTFDRAGTWTIIVNSLSPGTGGYTLSVSGCEIIPPCTKPDLPIGCNTTTTHALGGDDCRFGDGSYYEGFEFLGTAGQTVTVTMRSGAFDALFALFDPADDLVEIADDTETGSDASLTVTLTQTGTYTIVATSFEPGPTPGPFTIELTCGTVNTACTNGPERLCLNNRFLVTVQWKDFDGNIGSGKAVPQTADTGTFWFFQSTNLELMIKVLDGRGLNGRWWVFYGALSNVEYTITVTDTETGQVKTYFNPLNAFASRGDTDAF